MKKKSKFKKLLFISLVILNVNTFVGCTSLKDDILEAKDCNENVKMRVLDYNDVKNSLIRFHVIANSDSEEDQNLKLKVKNKVIDYLYPYLNASQSLEESRQIIKDKMSEVKKLSEEEIKNNRYNYEVGVQLSRENFPDKSYGNITLPQGNYEAFRVIIGSGQGKNWWCVMFPPLCFVDESKAQVEYDKTENRIKSSQNESFLNEGIKSDENKSEDKENGNTQDIQVKFKLVEILKGLFK